MKTPRELHLSQTNKLPPELTEFAGLVGLFIEYWGFKNIQGQIWAYLYLSKKPLDTQELMKRTSISKGLASLYLKEMLEYDVIQEVSKGPYGTTLYRANPNQDQVILNVLRKRERSMISKVQASLEQISSLPDSEKKKAFISEDGIQNSFSLIRHVTTVMDIFIRSQETIQNITSKIRGAFSIKK